MPSAIVLDALGTSTSLGKILSTASASGQVPPAWREGGFFMNARLCLGICVGQTKGARREVEVFGTGKADGLPRYAARGGYWITEK